MSGSQQRAHPDPLCPIRVGEYCTLCLGDGVTGPQDCQLVATVMSDDALREALAENRRAHLRSQPPTR